MAADRLAGEQVSHDGMTDGIDARPDVAIDTAQVAQIVDFYRQASQVVATASDHLRSHRFGTWVTGADYRELGERFVTMSAVIADRLAEQSVAATRLAEELDRASSAVTSADAEAAHMLRHLGPGSS